MYDRILVTIHPTPREENWSALQRTEQIGKGLFRVHVTRRDVVPEGISAGSGLGSILCAT